MWHCGSAIPNTVFLLFPPFHWLRTEVYLAWQFLACLFLAPTGNFELQSTRRGRETRLGFPFRPLKLWLQPFAAQETRVGLLWRVTSSISSYLPAC